MSRSKTEIIKCLDGLLSHRPRRVWVSEPAPLPPGQWKNSRCYNTVRLSFAYRGVNRIRVHSDGRWRELRFSPGEAVVYTPMSWTANVEDAVDDDTTNFGVVLWPDFIRLIHASTPVGKNSPELVHHLHIALSRCRGVASLLTAIGEVSARKDSGRLLPELLYVLLNMLRTDIAAVLDEDAQTISTPLQRWKAMCVHMAENFSSIGTRQEVAEHFNLSESSISKLFLRYGGGRTFNRMLTELKIEAAKRLLENSALDCRSIATACGFSSVNYFTQSFSRETGSSPGKYRRKVSETGGVIKQTPPAF